MGKSRKATRNTVFGILAASTVLIALAACDQFSSNSNQNCTQYYEIKVSIGDVKFELPRQFGFGIDPEDMNIGDRIQRGGVLCDHFFAEHLPIAAFYTRFDIGSNAENIENWKNFAPLEGVQIKVRKNARADFKTVKDRLFFEIGIDESFEEKSLKEDGYLEFSFGRFLLSKEKIRDPANRYVVMQCGPKLLAIQRNTRLCSISYMYRQNYILLNYSFYAERIDMAQIAATDALVREFFDSLVTDR